VVATPRFFTTSAETALPRDEVALVVPFPQKGRANRAMLWQTEAGMWFKMPGGYFVAQGPDGAAVREAPPSPTSLALLGIQRGGPPPRLTADLRRAIAQDFARWRVRSVVLGPMPNRRTMAGFLSDLLGRAPERVAGVELWANARVAGTTGTARIDARYATR
jgi:dolichyl-phosphate beta-glucosyltransferase